MRATRDPALRPMGFGDVLDRVFRLYRDRTLVLFVLAAIPFALLLATGAAAITLWAVFIYQPNTSVGAPERPAPTSSPGVASVIATLFLVAGLFSPVALILGTFIAGALVDAAAAAHLGQVRAVGSSLVAGLQSAPRLFLSALALCIAFVVVEFISVLIFAETEIQTNEPVYFFAMLAFLAAVLFLESSWFIVPAVATIERHGPLSSLRRSWQLVTGFRLKIIALSVLLLVVLVVLFIFGIGAERLVAALTDRHPPAVAETIALLLVMVAAWLPLFFGTMTVLYYDLRVRKEGFDLQLAAKAMAGPAIGDLAVKPL